MRKVCVSIGIVVLILGATSSCNNNDKAPEVKQEEVITVPAKPAEPVKMEPVTVKKDTVKTTVSIGPDGAAVKTKKGTNVSVSPGGVNVGTKDVKVDIKP